MFSSNKLKLFAATLFAAAAFTGCCNDDITTGDDGQGGQGGGNETKVVLPEGDKWVLFGDDATVSGSVVELNSAIYDIEEDGTYTFYFTEDFDVTTVDGMLAAEDVLVISGVSSPDGEQTGTLVTYTDLSHSVSSENYGDQSVSVTLDAEAVEMYVELTNGTENFRAKYTGECPEAALVDVNNAVAVGKANPTPIQSVVELRNEEDGLWTYYFYAEPDVTTVDEASALLVVTLPKEYVDGAVEYEEGMAPEFVQSFGQLAEGTEVEFTNLDATYAEGGEGELYAGIVDDPSGAATRQLELIYNNGDTLVRMSYNGVVTIVVDASNTAERNYGYSEDAVETALEGNVYSYTDAKGKYLLYSTVANAKSLADLKAEGYTVVFNLPNGEGVFEEMPVGFAATAYDYSIDGDDETLKSYFVNNNPQGTPAITASDKAYLTSKKLNMNDDGYNGFTYTTAGNSVYFAFEGTLTPAHNPMVRPSFRPAESFKAEYFGDVTAIEGSDDLHETLAPAGAGEEGSYIKVLNPDGQLILLKEITKADVYYDRRTGQNANTTGSMAQIFGLQVDFVTDNSSIKPRLTFANDLRNESDASKTTGSGSFAYVVPYANVVNNGPHTLDSSVVLAGGWSSWSMTKDLTLFELKNFNYSISYWSPNDTQDNKQSSGGSAMQPTYIASPFKYGTGWVTYYGTTEKGSIEVKVDEDTDVWTIDFEIKDAVYKYNSSDGSEIAGGAQGTKNTIIIHYEGNLTGYYNKQPQK